jgi:NAD(P)-dependent dehydrogenase (short-subunit alcohol dehydrogenase family)
VNAFEGKTAVVTGAASGIGFGLAERFAAEGMNVVMADVERPALEQAAEQLHARGATVLALPTDVTDADGVDRLAAGAGAAFGPVHVLCNNAGVGLARPIVEMGLDDWGWVLDVNLWGVIHGLRAFLPGMLAHGEPGHVVNTSSMAGLLAAPSMPVYSASKAAVLAISECLHEEMEQAGAQIGVSALCPGLVNTRVHLSERNRPGGDPSIGDDTTSRLGDRMTDFRAMEPSEVAACVVDAIHERRLYVFTHPEWIGMAAARYDRILDAARSASTTTS